MGGGGEENPGFTVRPRRSRKMSPLNITDLDFADDTALLSDTVSQAQELLDKVEHAAFQVGLHMNTKKTQFLAFNHPQDIPI